MKAVCPSLVVVHRNVFHDAGKLVEIRRWIDVGAPAAADAVIDFCAAGANGGDHFVGRRKIVACRLFRISAPVGKNDASIPRLHHPGALSAIGNQPGELRIAVDELGVDFRRPHGIVGT